AGDGRRGGVALVPAGARRPVVFSPPPTALPRSSCPAWRVDPPLPGRDAGAGADGRPGPPWPDPAARVGAAGFAGASPGGARLMGLGLRGSSIGARRPGM